MTTTEMLAETLLAARRNPADRPPNLGHLPADEAAAYAIQAGIQAQLGPIGGWKVGYNPATGAFTCAPCPAAGIHHSPARIDQSHCPDRGIEAEIAVTLAQDLPPRPTPYTTAEIRAAIASAHPAIELLQSRYRDVDAVDPLTNLADSLSHHALVVGPAIPDWPSIDLAHETVEVLVDGTRVKHATANPAGDMLPLITWLANTGATWAGGLKAGQVVTTGSWTGKDFTPPNAEVRMQFRTCGTVEAAYT